MRFGRCGPGKPGHVRDINADQDDRVDQPQCVLEEQGHPVQRCDRQVSDVDRLGPVEIHRGRGCALGLFRARPCTSDSPGAEEDHQRPSESDQELVGARHVRKRQCRSRSRFTRLSELAPGVRCQDEVNRVLRQHGDQGENRQGQPATNIQLNDLRRPGDHEGGSHDGHPVEGCCEDRVGVVHEQLDENAGNRRQKGDDHEGYLPRGVIGGCVHSGGSLSR